MNVFYPSADSSAPFTKEFHKAHISRRVDLTASGLIGFFIDCDPVSTDLGLDLAAVRVEHDLI